MGSKATMGVSGSPDSRTYLAEGGALTRGMAVIPGTAQNQVKAPAAVATGNLKVVGIVAEDAVQDAPVRVVVRGECVAIVVAAVAHGDILKTAGVAGKVEPTTTDNDGIFAVAVSDAAADGDEAIVRIVGPARY